MGVVVVVASITKIPGSGPVEKNGQLVLVPVLGYSGIARHEPTGLVVATSKE
jgi:hypothetical protein